MDIREGLRLLQKQIDKIDSLKQPPAHSPQYKIWKNTTLKILRECFDEDYCRMFKRVQPLQVTMSKEHQYQLYLQALDKRKQLLEGFIAEHSEYLDTALDIGKKTTFADYDFHPVIKETSQRLFEDGHYAESILKAYIRVISEVKTIMMEKVETVDRSADSMMNKAFGCDNQDPPIKFNSLSSDEERDEQRGIMYLFKGIVGIRNRKAHEAVTLNNPMRAIEYLALASLLMRLLDLSKEFDS